MNEIKWERYPHLSGQEQACTWLTIQAHLGLAANTLAAYARALDEYLGFCARREIDALKAKREHIALYVNRLADRKCANHTQKGLSNATMQQRLTAVRLYYDYLVEESLRERNPVGRGHYVPGRAFALSSQRGLLPQYRRLPWIPSADEWRAILEAARTEPLRNRFMLALSYDSALRREELCSLQTSDLDPAHHRKVVERPVEERGRDDADVDDVDPCAGEPAHEGIAQPLARRPVVAPDRHRAPHPDCGQVRGIRLPDRACRLDGQVVSDYAANVVLPKDPSVDRHECSGDWKRVGAAWRPRSGHCPGSAAVRAPGASLPAGALGVRNELEARASRTMGSG